MTAAAKSSKAVKPRPRAKSANGGPAAELSATVFQAICETLARTGAKYKSCEEHGFLNSTVMDAIRSQENIGDDSWRDSWNLALERWKETLEIEAYRRGHHGVVTEWKVLPLSGEKVPVKVEYSDRMLEVLMKGHFPERYRDNIHHSGLIGLEPVDAFSNLSAKAKREIRAIILRDLEDQREEADRARKAQQPPVIEGELIHHQIADLRAEKRP